MQKLNLQAFDKGFTYGMELMERLSENGETEEVGAMEAV